MTASRLISTERADDVLVVILDEAVSSYAEADLMSAVDELVTQLKAAQDTKIAVDFEQLPIFGSIVLEALRTLWMQLHTVDGKLALYGVSQMGREILHVAKLDTLWPVYESRDDALAALRSW